MFVRNSLETKRDHVSFYSFLKNQFTICYLVYVSFVFFSLFVLEDLRTKISRTVIINNKNRIDPMPSKYTSDIYETMRK